MPKEPIDWTRCDEAMVRQIFAATEAHLESMLTVAVSMDQRSATLGGIFTGAATALVAGILAYAGQGPVSPALWAACLLASGLFLLAALFCFQATSPTDFHLRGNVPEGWRAFLQARSPLAVVLGGEAENYADQIARNRKVLAWSAAMVRWGIRFAIAAPPSGLLAFFALAALGWR